MGEDLHADKLTCFKKNERPETVLLVADDPSLIRIVVAWTNTEVVRARELSPYRDDSECATWEWLWRNAVYSQAELIVKSAVSEYGFEKKMASLIGNRVLYPDGTINSFVQRYLRDRVLKLFDARPKRPARKP